MLRSIYLLSFLLLQSLFAFAGNVKENKMFIRIHFFII
jgi:hypothetical protein